MSIPGIPELLEDRRPEIQYQSKLFNNFIEGANQKIRTIARDESDAAKKSAQLVENTLYYMQDDFENETGGIEHEAIPNSIDQATSKGIGILHLEFAQDWANLLVGKKIDSAEELLAAFNLGEEGFTKNPFVLTSPDVNATAWPADKSRVSELGEKQASALFELGNEDIDEYLAKYGFTSDMMEESVKTDHMVKTYHLETREYIYDVIDASSDKNGMRLGYRKNVAGRPWYAFIPGTRTSSRNIHERYLPLIEAIYSLTQRLSIISTLKNSAAMSTGRIGYQEVAIGANAISAIDYLSLPSAEQKTAEYSFVGDKPENPRDGFEWKAMPVPDMTILMNTEQEIKDDIQRMGFAAALNPGSVLKAESGHDRNQQTEVAVADLETTLRNRGRAYKKLYVIIAQIARNLPVPINILLLDRSAGKNMKAKGRGTIEPEDWVNVDLFVTFENISLGAQSVANEMDEQAFTAGHISEETLMAKRYDDPIDEMNRIRSGRVAQAAEQKAMADITALLEMQAPTISEEILADKEVPLSTPEIAETLERRNERPAGMSVPGTGAPAQPPPQTQPGQTAPAASVTV